MLKLYILIFFLGYTACTSNDEHQLQDEITIHPKLHEDDDYYEIFKKSTRTREVYDNFETKYHIQATYLSPEFRSAFDKRLKDLTSTPAFNLGANIQKAGFFVSIFGPDAKKIDLNNQNLWSIILESNDKKFQPSVVRYLADKERWSPFFEHVHKWTKEYFIMFESSTISPPASDMLANQKFLLKLSNLDAAVSMSW